MWLNSILETIGQTPLIKLNKLTEGLNSTVLTKVEYFNPGQSVKDRIALKMIEDAERDGKIKSGGTIIEGTSGNTGMGLALAAVVKGYKCIFTTTDKQSMEKVYLLRALGADVKICPTNVEPDDPRSYYSVAKRLSEEIPNSYYPNQYDNPSNTQAHYESTGPEIWEQTEGKVTHFVSGMGTGGTITGTAKYLKEKNPNIKVIGIDSFGSVYKSYFETGKFDKSQIHPYLTEGIGEDIIPGNIDMNFIDDVIQCPDADAFHTTRALARKEGLFIGGSCGAAVWGALEYVKRENLDKNAVVVVLLPDSGTRYVSKIYNDEWMIQNGFMNDADLLTATHIVQSKNTATDELITALENDTLQNVIKKMNEFNISQMPVSGDSGFVGSINDKKILNHLTSAKSTDKVKVCDIMDDAFPVVEGSESVETLSQLLKKDNAAVLVKNSAGKHSIITRSDLIHTLANSKK